MRLTRTDIGAVLQRDGETLLLEAGWDELFEMASVVEFLGSVAGVTLEEVPPARKPVESQEVWAAGVTYYSSRDARMEESAEAGNADIYRRCYEAERPELFLKATPHRVAGPGEPVRIRRDSAWNVPEPEVALAISSAGEVFGYTVGNDMSSRDIEGENPLYLPQAKTYDGCAAIGPGIVVSAEPLPPETRIELLVERPDGQDAHVAFSGETAVERIRRSFSELTEYLFRETSFPSGCLLMTGTGIVPTAEFTLLPGDIVTISIEGVGVLTNPVVQGPVGGQRST